MQANRVRAGTRTDKAAVAGPTSEMPTYKTP